MNKMTEQELLQYNIHGTKVLYDELFKINFHCEYYSLYEKFPYISGKKGDKYSHKEVPKLLEGLGIAKWTGGVGAIFRFNTHLLPDHIQFEFWGKERLELRLRYSDKDGLIFGNSFTIMSKFILDNKNLPLRNPPYPRTNFYSYEDYYGIIKGAIDILAKLPEEPFL